MKQSLNTQYETNIFKIENCSQLSADYFLYEIIGLKESKANDDADDDFDVNIQYIIKSLAYTLRHPVTVVTQENKPYLVIRADEEIINRVPVEYSVKHGDVVYFKKIDNPIKLDFTSYNEQTKKIILRFLQFDSQSELTKNQGLWQPGSGDGFFNVVAYEQTNPVGIYTGFYSRVVELPTKGFGFELDITKKYISLHSLNPRISRNEFKSNRVNKSHYVYQYGTTRYEIIPSELSDLTVSTYKFTRPIDGKVVTLLQDIQEKFGPSMPPEVANLPDDASVLVYRTNDGQERAAIAALCYKVYDTEDPIVQKIHHKSIIKPFPRRRLIRIIHNNFFGRLMYGKIKLQVSIEPLLVEKMKFQAPDLLFGNDVSLSVRKSENSLHTFLEDLGKRRKALLFDESAGFYTNAIFETQYFLVPQTIYNMFGNEKHFLGHLRTQVNKTHPTDDGWNPIVITYDNRNKRTSVAIGFEILQKMEEKIKKGSGGYALIMLPSGVEKSQRQHDDLAALVVSECLEEYSITASIMHSDFLEKCFLYSEANGQKGYVIKRESKGKYDGYVKGVAINQVLLNNERWPYVLNTPLNADLTIGIDVKKHIAGFTFIDKYSKNILTKFDKSKNKERLSEGQIIKMLVKYIAVQKNNSTTVLRTIVIHRDGKLFLVERNGIFRAVELLKEKGVLPSDVSVNIVEIPKHSILQLRLFEVLKQYDILNTQQDNDSVLNPEIGSWVKINEREACLCTTGREFVHNGSSNPLYIKFPYGNMEIEKILEDIYYLSCLAYTKPDDCSRYPLTIKITDRRINILGSDFDMEALDVLKTIHS
ncbi:hypothetical protein QWZ08_19510 [Ferruginibacter paludis]|uniref:hypothetical protein n=1 Tax=Ferruginibacter paludis TaxID=1310417 RepID=UPI0025B3FE6B|nr:hypothetical protein [Ferruginibacter paludis]MDN3657849.1 hypothetical protein [Ferruginibacter paludis]